MNKTKIIATIGPSSQDYDVIKDLILNGTDVFRLNLSHASHKFCLDIIDKVRKIDEQLNTHTAILFDLKGPGIRIGRFINGKSFFKKNDKIRIYVDDIVGDNTKFSVSYKKLIEYIKFNSVIKIHDGLVELQVLDKGTGYLLCEVIKEGFISDGDNFNVPGVEMHIPFISKKDKEDIEFASKNKVDFLALSHVSSEEDVLEVNDIIIGLGNDHMSIISKIENENAVENIDDIINCSEGVMIARGDLGVEIPMEKVPGVQKSIINKCHIKGKISIVATELISSMERQLRPTRAEVSDIANAVLDGTDAVMLSGETTIGNYPVETLKIMEKIISASEEDINYLELLDKAIRTEKEDTTGTIAYSVAECASRLKCKAIISPTNSGYTARKMSRFRPSCPIIAVSPDINTVKNLKIYFGVHPVYVDELDNFDKIMKKSKEITVNLIDTERGDKIIITGGYPFKEIKHTNFMKIEEL